jgi:predicted transcriptional regulator
MTGSVRKLRLLDDSTAFDESDLVSELFHQINRIIPIEQTVLKVSPDCLVRDAIGLMLKHGFTQLPVVSNNEVLGVFTYRAFAKEAASLDLDEMKQQRCAPGDLHVDEFLEQFSFARVTEEIVSVFESLDRDDAILVSTPTNLIGVLTPMDFLKYLYRVASPFVLISEIELSLRTLIRHALKDESMLEAAAKRSLLSIYKTEERIPKSLEEMTFDNYQVMVSHGENWELFEVVLGNSRNRVCAKLTEIRNLRNDIFHFKREITMADHQTLAAHRDWLLSKVKQIKVATTGEAKR